MNFRELVEIVGNEPIFETGFLLAGDVDPADVQRQLSRWTKAEQLYQLRRGLYALAPPYQKISPHPFYVANRLIPTGSYVSLQSALGYYGLIPEYVPIVTSVTTGRPTRWDTPLGTHEFRHIKTELLYGYQSIDFGQNQAAFVATPEKALLDLIYLEPKADSLNYLEALRLQNVEQLDLDQLQQFAQRAKSPKLVRAVSNISAIVQTETEDYEAL